MLWMCLCFWVASLSLAAEAPLGRLPVRALTTQDGLPQNNIHALAMDQAGRLWLGTTEGAAFLDGSGWTTVEIPDGAGSNFVTSILPASNGAVWFGRQDAGVSRLFRGEWTTFTPAHGFVHPRVNALAETTSPDGRPIIWAGTHGAGLAKFEDGQWTVLDHRDGLPDDRIWRLYPTRAEDGSQALWIGTDEGGVMRLEHGRLIALPRLPRASVNAFLRTRDGEDRPIFWAGTYGFGLARLDGDRWTRFTQKDGLPSDFITDLAEVREIDGSVSIWACTLRGLAVFRHQKWETLDTKAGLPGNITHRLLVRQGLEGGTRMWVGTGGFGLFLLDLGGWRKVDRADGLPDSSIHSVLEVDGDLYAGTALGLARLHRGKWDTFKGAERISALAATGPPGRKTLWVGSLGGLDRLEAGRWTHFSFENGLPNNRISSLLPGRGPAGQATLWVGTEGGGLARFDGRSWTRFGAAEGLDSNLISGLIEVPNGKDNPTFWVGSRDRGVFRHNPDESWTHFGTADGLPAQSVLCLGLVQRNGQRELWAGTQGKGLATLALDIPQSKWKPLTFEELPKGTLDTVFGVLQVRTGDILLTGPRGVVRLKSDVPNVFKIKSYTVEDGLPSDACTVRSLLEDAAGRVIVGTVGGLAILDPHGTPIEHPSRSLRFRSVTGPDLNLHEEFVTGKREFSRRQANLTFDFTLVTLTRWRETLYQTQLAGLEASPTPWGIEHRRQFTRLPPGRYQFLVWAKDYAGTRSGPLTFSFTIKPAPWQTWWFYGLCLLAALGLLWLAIRTRERLLVAHNKELADLVAAQTGALQATNLELLKEVQERKVAERAKDEFTSMISHELRTPLTAIRGSLGLVASGALDHDLEARKKMLEISQRNAIRLLVLVNDLLDMQKIEAGMLSLQPEVVSLEETLTQTVQANLGFAEGFGVKLELAPVPQGLTVWADPLRLEQAFTNLLSNAAKFSRSGGQVRITTEALPHWAKVSIFNSGEPIPEAFRSQVFDKFSQSDIGTTRAVKGTGLGLAITKAIVDGLGGRIDFESTEEGTTFWIELPRDKP